MVSNLNINPDSQSPMRDRIKEDWAVCGKCNCSYFEVVEVYRINKFSVTTIGQKPATIGPGPFILLRCGRCKELHEPNLTYSSYSANTAYLQMKKEMEDTDTLVKDNGQV